MSDWKYDVDEVGDDGAKSSGDGMKPSGDRPESKPLEPGRPSAENVVFVVLGALTMLFVIYQLVSLA